MTLDEDRAPVAAPEISLCAECAGLLDDSRDQANHQGRRVERCLVCAVHSLCSANPKGPHERVLWPEDPDYDPSRLEGLPGPVPDDVRRGYCHACLQTFWEREHGVFEDLGWERVAVLWAERYNPDVLLAVESVKARVAHYWVEASKRKLWVRLVETVDEQPRQWYVGEAEPFQPHGQMLELLSALGCEPGTEIDMDHLVGREVVVESRDGEVVALRAA